MKLFHLSHTDLDGYGCQFVASKFAKETKFYNSNYGNEISLRFSQFFSDINKIKNSGKLLALVTDLNLTTDQCEWFESECEKLKTAGLDLDYLLLDHHVTGQQQADRFSWYSLDNDRSATMMTLDYFKAEHQYHGDEPDKLDELVNTINAIDLWKERDSGFEFGKTLMRMIADSKEINKVMFAEESVRYKHFLLHEASKMLHETDRHIALDDSIHFFKKKYLRDEGENNSMDNLISRYITTLLGRNKKNYEVTYKDHKGLLTAYIGNVSVIANTFLATNPEYDFFLDVSGKGNISIRASGKLDVSQMAKDVFAGGGHRNASGGKIAGFKDSISYDELKNSVQKHIVSKTYGG